MKQVPINKTTIKTAIIDILVYIIGSAIFAVSLNTFTAPNEIAPGGYTGIATLINYIFNIPIGLVMFILNIPVLLIALKVLGIKFLAKTIIATATLSITIDTFGLFLPAYTGNKLLACLFGGFLSGAGLALLFLRGATSGGTDIIAKLIRIKRPHVSMGHIILIFDIIIITASGFIYKSLESALFATIVIFINSYVIDYVLYGTGHGKMVMIFTKHKKEISDAIVNEVQRGVSILNIEGGYTKEQKNLIICAVRSNEVPRISKIVKAYDEQPFMLISEIGEIVGQGFKLKDT